jgi:hypothetical protein
MPGLPFSGAAVAPAPNSAAGRTEGGANALTDPQMVAVMDAAADLPPDKRDVFPQRFAARLKLRDVASR